MGEETKTEIRGSDGSKFEEESMWQGKPVSRLEKEKNHCPVVCGGSMKSEIPGVISRNGYMDFLSLAEYAYWQLHVLPHNWFIISKPERLKEGVK